MDTRLDHSIIKIQNTYSSSTDQIQNIISANVFISFAAIWNNPIVIIFIQNLVHINWFEVLQNDTFPIFSFGLWLSLSHTHTHTHTWSIKSSASIRQNTRNYDQYDPESNAYYLYYEGVGVSHSQINILESDNPKSVKPWLWMRICFQVELNLKNRKMKPNLFSCLHC